MFKIIRTTNNKKVLVDSDDYEKLVKIKWCTGRVRKSNIYYAKASGTKIDKILMHRFILNITDSKIFVDHINGNSLDNRKENLRLCNNSQNLCNRGPQLRNKLKLKNIWHDKIRNRYCVDITVNYNKVFRGRFKDLSEAISERNKALIKFHCEFANILDEVKS